MIRAAEKHDPTTGKALRRLNPDAIKPEQLFLFWFFALVIPLLAILILLKHSELALYKRLKIQTGEQMLNSMVELQNACSAKSYFKRIIYQAEEKAGLPPEQTKLVGYKTIDTNIRKKLLREFSAIPGFELIMLITGNSDGSNIAIYHDHKRFANYPRPGKWATGAILKAATARMRGLSGNAKLTDAEQRMLRNFTQSIFGNYFDPMANDENFSSGFNVRNNGSNLHSARRIVKTVNSKTDFVYMAIFRETGESLIKAFESFRSEVQFSPELVLRNANLAPFMLENSDSSLSLYAPLSYISLNTDPHRKNNLLNHLLYLRKKRGNALKYPHLKLTSQPLHKAPQSQYLYARLAIFLIICLSLLFLKQFFQNGMPRAKIRQRLFIAVFIATILPASAFLFMAYRYNRQRVVLRQHNLIKEMQARLKLLELNLRAQDERIGMQGANLARKLRSNMQADDETAIKIIESADQGTYDGIMLLRSSGLNYARIDPTSTVLQENLQHLNFSRDIFLASVIKIFDYIGLASEEFYTRLATSSHGRKLKAISALFSREDVENFFSSEGTAQTSKKHAVTLRFIKHNLFPRDASGGFAAVLLLVQDIRRTISNLLNETRDWTFYNQPGKEGLIETRLIATYDLDASRPDYQFIWPIGSQLNFDQRKLLEVISSGEGETNKIIEHDKAPPLVMVARKIGGYPLIGISQCSMQKLSMEMSKTDFVLIACFIYLLIILSLLASILNELLVTPIQQLLTAARLTGEGRRLTLNTGFTHELSSLASEFNKMNKQVKEREHLARFVSSEAVAVITQESRELREIAAQKEFRSILFMHIRNFDQLSETLEAEDLIELLNRYFAFSENLVKQNRGQIDKYIADAVMAVFSDQENHTTAITSACACALALKKHIIELNNQLTTATLPQISIGLGIASGEVIAGRIGASSGRRDYTVIGDRVNLAARLESMSHFSEQMHILVDTQTREAADNQYVFASHGKMPVKGKTFLVEIYELLDNK